MKKDKTKEVEEKKNKKNKKNKKEKKKLPTEVSQKILKKIFKNLLKAIGIMAYFVILNMAYTSIKHERLIGDIEVFAGTFLVVGIIMLEKAYRKEKLEPLLSSIELFALSFHSLSIMRVISMYKYDFRLY